MMIGSIMSDAEPIFGVLIETASNQHYVFQSNRLRENLGASELLYRIGTQWVAEAASEVAGVAIGHEPEALLDPARTQPIEGGDTSVEPIVLTSGKAILLVRGRERAKALVAAVTARALREAPGAVVRGYVTPQPVRLEDAGAAHRMVTELHRGIETVRHALPAPEARFQALPVVAVCQSTGLPASVVSPLVSTAGEGTATAPDRRHDDALSLVMHGKREVAKEIADNRRHWRVVAALGEMPLPRSLTVLEQMAEVDRIAIVHADGNGLGQVFLKFDEYVSKKGDNRTYLDEYRRFSLALEVCTVGAVTAAVRQLDPVKARDGKRMLPFVPIVLGGDDLTAIVDGRQSVPFTKNFLREFERLSGDDLGAPFGKIVPKVAERAFRVRRLGAAAGVAVVPPHFPFHDAYDLADSLCRSAKATKGAIRRSGDSSDAPSLPCCSFDVHVLFESVGIDLDEVRGQLENEDKSTTYRFYQRPYVVSSLQTLGDAAPAGLSWARARSFDDIEAGLDELRRSDPDDPDRRLIPSGQLHTLREGLFLGPVIADGRLREMQHRYQDADWGALLGGDGSSLFVTATDETPVEGESALKVTRLLDLMELHDLQGTTARLAGEQAG